MADLVIRGGRVWTPAGWRTADVLATGGRIDAMVEPGQPDAGEEVDAAGLWVLPGAVDAHVHSRQPGFAEKEDWSSLTAAAAAGGVTTVADMPNTVPSVDRPEVFYEKVEIAEAEACVDFALWGIARSTSSEAQIAGLIEAGVVGLKAYLGYSVRRDTGQVLYVPERSPDLEPPPTYEELLPAARMLARAGRPLAVHAEDPSLLTAHAREVHSYADLLASRPDRAEAVAIEELSRLCAGRGLRLHIVHLASAAGLEAAARARSRGVALTVETCPQYLWLTADDAVRLGPVLKMFPLVRGLADRAALRAGLVGGLIDQVGTDHAPHTDEEKLGRSWSEAAAGSPGVQTLYLSCLELARGFGRPELAALWAAANPARLLGLYPRKGSIEPGADADLVLVDPEGQTDVTAAWMRSNQRHGVFNGTRFSFAIRAVYLRGRPVGAARGRLVRPSPP